jgi:hypothetical protein
MSSTALFGNKASNGVVLVTTKKRKKKKGFSKSIDVYRIVSRVQESMTG